MKYKIIPIIILFLITAIGNALACSPSAGDPWFKISLSFDENSLPDGISIVETSPIYEPYALKNLNNEPFYIVTLYKLNKDYYNEDYPNSELPSDFIPKYKLISEKVYYYGQKGSSRDPLGWKENSGGINNAVASQVGLADSHSISDILLVEDDFKNVYSDDRPDNIEIPNQQPFKILGYYKDNLVELTGKISYSLNDEYYAHSRADGIEACNDWVTQTGRSFPFIIIVGIILIIIVIGFLIFRFKTKK